VLVLLAGRAGQAAACHQILSLQKEGGPVVGRPFQVFSSVLALL